MGKSKPGVDRKKETGAHDFMGPMAGLIWYSRVKSRYVNSNQEDQGFVM